jgi:hypothetical protein
MANLPPQLPRRHAQRVGLHNGRGGVPSAVPANVEEQRRLYEPRIKKKNMHRRKQLASLHAGNELRLDSGYNSQSESESETVSYRRKIADFSKAGVNLSNHGDDTKIMIARAEKFWAL